MPGFDGTGPLGEGPFSGRSNGYCILKNDSDNHKETIGFIGIMGWQINGLYKLSSCLNSIYKEELMPRGDGTGPNGFGSMTGRAAGFCAGYSTPGFVNPIGGLNSGGRGKGIFGGRGRGFRNNFYLTGLPRYQRGHPIQGNFNSSFQSNITPEQEIEYLKNQAEYIKENYDDINRRINELENKPVADEK